MEHFIPFWPASNFEFNLDLPQVAIPTSNFVVDFQFSTRKAFTHGADKEVFPA